MTEYRPTWAAQMRAELADILGIEIQHLPLAFSAKWRHRKVLKHGILADLCAAYPSADRGRIHNWLQRYTDDIHYLKRVCRYAKHRHDLNGHHHADITSRERRNARRRLMEILNQEHGIRPSRYVGKELSEISERRVG